MIMPIFLGEEEEALLRKQATGKCFFFRSYPVANQGATSDDCEKMNASASDAIESAAKSVWLGFVDLRLAFVFPRDETKSERDGAFTVHQ